MDSLKVLKSEILKPCIQDENFKHKKLIIYFSFKVQVNLKFNFAYKSIVYILYVNDILQQNKK